MEKESKLQCMTIKTSTKLTYTPINARNVNIEDAKNISPFLHDCYKGTVDATETLEEITEDIHNSFAGKYGEALLSSSFIIKKKNEILAVSLVTLYKGTPLLAEIATNPKYQRKGIAYSLICKTIEQLYSEGYQNLFLTVTKGNPAETLYKKIGFTVSSPPIPK